MTDRQLLEFAALAVGIKGEYAAYFTDDWGLDVHDKHERLWNPLTDDGDALRLAVRLGMDLGIYLPTDREPGMTYANTKALLGYGTDGYRSYQSHAYCKEEHTDPFAATRRAIVRAAAEIGRRMK